MRSGRSVLLPSLMAAKDPFPAQTASTLEKQQGRNIVHALARTFPSGNLELVIFSALSYAKLQSNEKFTKIYHFDAKAENVSYLESHFTSLGKADWLSKVVVLQLGMFASNGKQASPIRATKQSDGRYRVLMPCGPGTNVPFIEPDVDPGIFAKGIANAAMDGTLPTPIVEGRIRQFAGFAEYTTLEEWVNLIGKYSSEEVYLEECSIEEWATKVPAKDVGIEIAEMWKYVEEVGYFGGDEGTGGYKKITDVSVPFWTFTGGKAMCCREQRTDVVVVQLQLEREPSWVAEYVKKEGRSLLFEE
jgi:hypothetical protein